MQTAMEISLILVKQKFVIGRMTAIPYFLGEIATKYFV
jgi:hypothetical protein